MTMYVVPCGVSILDGLISKADKRPRDAKPGRLVKSAADLGDGVLARRDEEVCAWWADNAAAHADEARLLKWEPRVLCAETNSLAASSGLEPLRGLLDRGDRVLVLASDTSRGVAAALYVAQHIAGTALPDVAYLTTPDGLPDTPLPLRLDPGTLTIVRLRGLDPRGKFVEAVAGIGRLLRAAADTGGAVEVHLTGGFKATLLHTLAMTEVLYSLAADRVRACYVFEDSDDPHATVTSIGMRRFDQVDTDDMRRELKGIRDGDRNKGARTFEGLAWTESGGLNAFGYGYLAVLGERLTPGRPGLTGP
ncbi:MAG: hypothetical protein ACRDRJ_10985 [Streptosporangiaceae bacterium]